jgi:hypothetical protein
MVALSGVRFGKRLLKLLARAGLERFAECCPHVLRQSSRKRWMILNPSWSACGNRRRLIELPRYF